MKNDLQQLHNEIKTQHKFNSAPIFKFKKLAVNKPIPNELHAPFESFHIEVGDTRYWMTEDYVYDKAIDHRVLYSVVAYKPFAPSGEKEIRQFEIIRRDGEIVVKQYFEMDEWKAHADNCKCRESLFGLTAIIASKKQETPFLMSIPSSIEMKEVARALLLGQVMDWEDGGLHQQTQKVCPHITSMVHLCVQLLSMVEQINSKEYRPSSEMSRQVRRNAQRKGILHPVPYIMLPAKSGNSNGDGKKHIEHRYRYRVRGHWRHLTDKKVWVKPHERGLKNLICLQKEYIVGLE